MAQNWMPIARRYAEALFSLAREGQNFADVGTELAATKGALEADVELRRVLADELVRPTAKVAALKKKFPGSSLVSNTLCLMALRGRCAAFPAFFEAFAEALDRHHGLVRVAVESATALKPADLDALRAGLKASLGGDVALDATVDPAVLGGLRLKFGSTFVDGSTASKLDRLKSSILARA